MLASVQRTRPASTRCSAHHSTSRGSGLPPSALRASPARSTVTSKCRTRGRIGTAGADRRPVPGLACERMERLRTLSEAECYERCYGWRYTEDAVKVLPRSGVGREHSSDDVGERLRVLLELRLDAR